MTWQSLHTTEPRDRERGLVRVANWIGGTGKKEKGGWKERPKRSREEGGCYLQRAEVTVVVLDDLGGQVLEHILLHPPQEEGQHLAMQSLHGQNA